MKLLDKITEYAKYFYISIPFIIILLIMHKCQVVETEKLSKKVQENYNLLRVSNDSLRVYKDKNGQLVYEKNSLQNNFKTLNANYNILSENQKALVNEVKKTKNLIAAVRTEMIVKLDSINNTNVEIINDSTGVAFKDSSEFIKYDIEVTGVKPIEPKLLIKELELPNHQIVTHEFAKDGGVKVSVKNSNPYFKVTDVDGYIIPKITQETVKPNKLKKIWSDVKKIGGGAVGGAVLVTLAIIFL